MFLFPYLLVYLISPIAALPQSPPAQEEYGGGVFGIGNPLGSGILGSLGSLINSGSPGNRTIASMVCGTASLPMSLLTGSSSTIDGKPVCERDDTGGSGPYKAQYTTDAGLENHTIYAPINLPLQGDQKLGILVWGNGGCFAAGTMFKNFLTEIASHGFMVLASGAPVDTLSVQSKVSDLTRAIDWVTSPSFPTARFGAVDTRKLVVAGQSCGGLEAYSAGARDERVRNIVLFNSGVLRKEKRALLAGIKVPVAYFLGGKGDVAGANGEADYAILPAVPALLASADFGHTGTYYQKHGGKMGKVAVNYLKWKVNGDAQSKALFCGSGSSLVTDGWNITSKNGMC